MSGKVTGVQVFEAALPEGQVEEEVELLRWHKGRHVGEAAAIFLIDSWYSVFYTARARVPT